MEQLAKRIVATVWNRIDPPVFILLYHRVTSLNSDPQQLAVSPDNFDAHMKLLKEHYHVLTPQEFEAIRRGAVSAPKNAVLITFDDGYADNLLEAMPILEKYHVRALFFVATGLLGSRLEFWWDQLERIFLYTPSLPDRLSLTIRGTTHTFTTTSMAYRRSTYEMLHPMLKDCAVDERDSHIKLLCEWAGVPLEGRASHRVMTIEELKHFSRSPSVVIGAHTHHHPKLSVLPFDEQLREISTSKNILESVTGNPIRYFSYPFGSRADYNNNSKEVCSRLGFSLVFANLHAATRRKQNDFELTRLLVRNWNREDFQDHLKSFF